MSRSFALLPRSTQVAVAPFRRLETMKSLKRAATIATLRSRAVISSSRIRRESMVASGFLADVALDFQVERRNAVDLLRCREHAHSAHTQIFQDLRPDAVCPEHLADLLIGLRDDGGSSTHRPGRDG